jgi:integral membrane sensor domain MASE1
MRGWRGWRLVLELAGLTAAYIAAAKLGLMMDAVAGFATLVWPASGLALAAMLLRGNRLWPAVALGAFLTNLWHGAPPAVAMGIAVGNTLEALAGATAIRHIPGFSTAFDRVRDALALVFVALSSTTISATLGVLSLTAGGILATDNFCRNLASVVGRRHHRRSRGRAFALGLMTKPLAWGRPGASKGRCWRPHFSA